MTAYASSTRALFRIYARTGTAHIEASGGSLVEWPIDVQSRFLGRRGPPQFASIRRMCPQWAAGLQESSRRLAGKPRVNDGVVFIMNTMMMFMMMMIAMMTIEDDQDDHVDVDEDEDSDDDDDVDDVDGYYY